MVEFLNFTLSHKLLNSNKYVTFVNLQKMRENGSSFWPIKTKSSGLMARLLIHTS